MNTRNVGTSSFIPKNIKPGNVIAHVVSAELIKGFNYDSDKSLNIELLLETEAIGGEFEGFSKDPNNPNLGKYLGQIGKVKVSAFDFKDGTTKKGTVIKRDDNIVKVCCWLADSFEVRNEFDNQCDNLEDGNLKGLVAILSSLIVGKDVRWCIAGTEYTNKQGYPAYTLYLPNPDYAKKLYPVGVVPERVIDFDKSEHIKVKKEKVEPVSTSNNFDL